MTENEAKVINRISDLAGDYKCYDERLTHDEALVLDRLLSEIQQYRAIGTVEGYKRAVEVSKENYYLCAEYKARLKEYEAIGTIEEFKALKEKSLEKKPIYSDFDENEAGEIIPYKAVCPVCGHEFEFGTWNDEENHHCDCGQKLDWSE